MLECEQKMSDSYVWKSLCCVIRIFKCCVEGRSSDPDSWLWRSGGLGEYSVKEGYRVAYRWKLAKFSNQGEPTDTTHNQQQWKFFGGFACWIE